MRFASSAVTKSILIVCLALCLMIALNFQAIMPKLAITRAASTTAALQTDPSVVGQWSAPMAWPAVAIHTHVLPNGKVLTWERKDSDLTTQTYLWDPATGSFTQIFNPNTHVFCSGHSFLPDGRLLVTGGHHFFDGDGEPHTNIFDYNTNTWTRVADMNAGRWYPTNTALGNGETLTVSGLYWDGTLNPDGTHHHVNNTLPQVWQTNGTWRSLVNAPQGMSLYPWMLLAPDGRVFNSGPQKSSRFLNTSGSGAWTDGPDSNLGVDPSAETRVAGTSVMYDDGKVLIVGGGSPPTNTTEVIDLNSPTPAWRYVGSMSYPRRQLNATILPDGKVLVTGGTSAAGFNNPDGSVLPAEMWDPATETWSIMANMQVRRLYHSTAVLLPDGRVLSAGGGMPPGAGTVVVDTDHPDAEIYSPPYLFKGARPTITSAPTTVNYGETFSVQTPNATSITKVTWVRLSSVTHTFNENQRINRLSFSQAAGGLNVTAPSNRNVCPPGHYMLFILNGIGVPSVAKIVKVQDSEGFFDGADCNQIWGWAWDKNNPNNPINVDIYDGASKIATVPANLFRQDLLNAGKGNGYHAFGYSVPSFLRDGQTHSISVKFGGTSSNLGWSPRSIICGASMFPSLPGPVSTVSAGGSTWEQATKFYSSISGKITHVRFYKAPGETGTHVGRIWSESGVLLAQVTFTNETASGWQEKALVTPLQINAGVRYRVSYNVNSFGAKIVNGLTQPITNGPLTAWSGFYSTPAGTFPNTGSASNFLADIRFSAP